MSIKLISSIAWSIALSVTMFAGTAASQMVQSPLDPAAVLLGPTAAPTRCDFEQIGPIGKPVPIQLDSSLKYMGLTSTNPPLIRLNPTRFDKSQPEEFQVFVFRHECGHINGEGATAYTVASEVAASCYAARRMPLDGGLNGGSLLNLVAWLIRTQPFPSQAGLPDGAGQGKQIQWCQQNKTGAPPF
jgi:hypothetical protein